MIEAVCHHLTFSTFFFLCWRRWEWFLRDLNIDDLYLDSVSTEGRRLLAKCFMVVYRGGKFDKQGRNVGKRKTPMVAVSVRDAISHVAAAFWAANRASSSHYNGGVAGPNYLRKELKELLKAFENQDPT